MDRRRGTAVATAKKGRPPAAKFPELTQEQQALVLTGLDFAHHVAIRAARFIAFSVVPRPTKQMIDDLFSQLVGAAYNGLCRGAQGFQPERGNKFLTYAGWWVRQFVQAELPYLHLIVGCRSPKSTQRLTVRLASCLSNEIHAADFHGDNSTFDVLNHRVQHHPSRERLRELQLEDRAAYRQLAAKLAVILNDDQLMALWQRFVMGRKIREIGKLMRLSKERVRQLYGAALDKIRRNRKLMAELERRMPLYREEPATHDFSSNVAFTVT